MNVKNYHYLTENIEHFRCPAGSPEENKTLLSHEMGMSRPVSNPSRLFIYYQDYS
jgi:hypothetical protein